MGNSQKYIEMRRNHPNPSKGGGKGGYCVGGAFCRTFNGNIPFPTAGQLSKLMVSQLGLSTEAGSLFANKVITENDRGNFNKAWDWLAAAMRV